MRTIGQHLTEKEMAVINAILNSEYLSENTDPVWIEGLAEEAGLTGKEFSGVVSSLVQKEIVATDGLGNDGTIALTDYGVDLV